MRRTVERLARVLAPLAVKDMDAAAAYFRQVRGGVGHIERDRWRVGFVLDRAIQRNKLDSEMFVNLIDGPWNQRAKAMAVENAGHGLDDSYAHTDQGS